MRTDLFTLWELTKLMTKRYLRNRLALFFTLIFPLIFLFIFGGVYGNNSSASFKVAVINQSQTSFAQTFAKHLADVKAFKIMPASSLADAKAKMGRSELDATIVLPPSFGQSNHQGLPSGQATVLYNENNAQGGQTVGQILQSSAAGINAQLTKVSPPVSVSLQSTAQKGLTSFDYIFSGLIGFSLIGLGIFGPVNMMPAEKKTGALTRLRVTPLRPWQFILAYMLSSLVSAVMSIGAMVLVAILFFHFHAVGNYLEFILFTLLGTITIFGIGVGVGGWARDEKQAAPLSNLVSFPLMFLSGTFFPRFLMPEWLQQITAFLPLTPIVDGIRMILTEGKSLLDLGPQLGLMAIWTVAIYLVAFRVFRWE